MRNVLCESKMPIYAMRAIGMQSFLNLEKKMFKKLQIYPKKKKILRFIFFTSMNDLSELFPP